MIPCGGGAGDGTRENILKDDSPGIFGSEEVLGSLAGGNRNTPEEVLMG